MRSKTLTLSFLVALGCAKGQEIDLEDVVILPLSPPSVADASAAGSGEAGTATNEVPAPAPEREAVPPAGEPSSLSPAVDARDAGAPPLVDSGT